MRTINIIRVALLTIFLLMLIGCERANPAEDSQEVVTVGFKTNLIDISESPMRTKAFSNRDIFAVEIHDENGKYYACWLTSDLGTDKIRLLKGKHYICYLVYMPNGQDIVWQYPDGTFDRPFCGTGDDKSPLINKGVHYGAYSVGWCNFGGTRKKELTTPPRNGDYEFSGVDLYYVIVEICANEDINITIDLYRMVFGLKIDVSNFKQGEIYFGNFPSPSATMRSAYYYKLTPENPTLDKIFEISYMPYSDHFQTPDKIPSKEQLQNWSSSSHFQIVYVAPDGAEFVVVEKDLEAKRMTKYTISFDLEAVISEYNGGITANVIDDSWSDSE